MALGLAVGSVTLVIGACVGVTISTLELFVEVGWCVEDVVSVAFTTRHEVGTLVGSDVDIREEGMSILGSAG